MDLKFVFETKEAMLGVIEKFCSEMSEHATGRTTVMACLIVGDEDQDQEKEAEVKEPELGTCFKEALKSPPELVPLWKVQYMFLWILYMSRKLQEIICQHSPKPIRKVFMEQFELRFNTHLSGKMIRQEKGSKVAINATDPLNYTISEFQKVHLAYTTK